MAKKNLPAEQEINEFIFMLQFKVSRSVILPISSTKEIQISGCDVSNFLSEELLRRRVLGQGCSV